MDRAILIPADPSSTAGIEAALHLADWYAANLKLPGDRLVFVSVLVPEARHGDLQEDALAGVSIEASMERQLAESCRGEERLAARLKARGCPAFRYIHAFGRGRTETLARIAVEQKARLLLATYDTIAADCWDLGCAFRLFKRARLALVLAPDAAKA